MEEKSSRCFGCHLYFGGGEEVPPILTLIWLHFFKKIKLLKEIKIINFFFSHATTSSFVVDRQRRSDQERDRESLHHA